MREKFVTENVVEFAVSVTRLFCNTCKQVAVEVLILV